MDLRKIKKLIELLEESDLAEMEIREGEESIRLSRATSVSSVMVPQAAMPAVAPAPAAAPVPAPAASAPAAEAPVSGHTVTSPMVGTFYASPDPEQPAYVSVGSNVKAGDTLCIIEAMKTFNPVEADRAGTVTAIHKSNGEPVEFGEAIFVID